MSTQEETYQEVNNPVVAVIRGGVLQAAYLDRPADVVVIDYDDIDGRRQELLDYGVDIERILDLVCDALGGRGIEAQRLSGEALAASYVAGTRTLTRDSVAHASEIGIMLGRCLAQNDKLWCIPESKDDMVRLAAVAVVDTIERLDHHGQIDWEALDDEGIRPVLVDLADEIHQAVMDKRENTTDWPALVRKSLAQRNALHDASTERECP